MTVRQLKLKLKGCNDDDRIILDNGEYEANPENEVLYALSSICIHGERRPVVVLQTRADVDAYEEIKASIKAMRSNGCKDRQIKSYLLETGYEEEEIDLFMKVERMNYKDFNIGDWIGHISGAIEDERELDGNEMRDLVEFLTKFKSAIFITPEATNGEVIKAIFPDFCEKSNEYYFDRAEDNHSFMHIEPKWWHTRYAKERKNEKETC